MAVTDDWVPEISFGHRLKLVRLQKKLTQEEAADRCGIDRNTWSKWERNIHVPHDKAEVADKINAALGVNRTWLVWGQLGCFTVGEAEGKSLVTAA